MARQESGCAQKIAGGLSVASRFDEMYEELMASPELECRTYYSGIEAERMKFYSDIVSGYISGKECQESKCYYDIGNGFMRGQRDMVEYVRI